MSGISVGSVSVDITPNTRQFAERLRAELRDVVVRVRVEADTRGVQAELDRAAHDRTATIRANVDKSSLSNARAALGGVSGMGALIGGLGPALIPITAAVAGLSGLLAVPVAAAGGGLTVGALLGGAAVAETKKQEKVIGDLAKRVSKSQQALLTASTPAGKKTAQAQLTADTKAYQAALQELTPAQSAFRDAQGKLKDSFDKLLKTNGGDILGPLTKGLDLLAKVLPKLAPLLVGVSKGVGTLLGDLGRAVSGPGFKRFITAFGGEAQRSIVAFGRIFFNVIRGFAGLFGAFNGQSGGFVKSLVGMSKAFAKWGTGLGASKGFQAFLGYVKQVGPLVARTIGHVALAVIDIVKALAPLGTLVLTGIDALAKAITRLKPGQLTLIAATLGAVALAVAAIGGPAVLIVPAIVAVAAGVKAAYDKFKPFRDVVASLVGWFKRDLLPALVAAGKVILPALHSAFESVKSSISHNYGLFKALGEILKLVGDYFIHVWIPVIAQVAKVVFPLLGKAIGLAITGVRLLALGYASMAVFAIGALKLLVRAAIIVFGNILKAADTSLGWIPGLGDKIHAARKTFDTFGKSVVGVLDKAESAAKRFRDTLDQATKPRKAKIAVTLSGANFASKGGAEGVTARANGGPVVAGRPYIVGERRPELFVPSQNGRIEPRVGGSGGTMEIAGMLGIDRDGVAYIKGQAQQVVSSTDAHKAVQRRAQQAGQARPQ